MNEATRNLVKPAQKKNSLFLSFTSNVGLVEEAVAKIVGK